MIKINFEALFHMGMSKVSGKKRFRGKNRWDVTSKITDSKQDPSSRFQHKSKKQYPQYSDSSYTSNDFPLA